MAELRLFGPPQSSYVWATRMLCGEKGIDYELVPEPPGSDENLRHHPFGKVPVMQHGDLTLFETSAIMRYLDDAFDGPKFVPSDTAQHAVMEKWISAFNSYMYDDIVRGYVIPSAFGRATTESNADVLPIVQRHIAILNRALEDRPWLAGADPTLADILLGPPIQYLSMFPEGRETLADAPHLSRWLDAVRDRPSLMAAAPPPPG